MSVSGPKVGRGGSLSLCSQAVNRPLFSSSLFLLYIVGGQLCELSDSVQVLLQFSGLIHQWPYNKTVNEGHGH